MGAMKNVAAEEDIELHYLPETSATAWWQYMRVQRPLDDTITEDIFVPSLMILMNPASQLFTMLLWPKGIAQFFPRSDYVYLQREKKSGAVSVTILFVAAIVLRFVNAIGSCGFGLINQKKSIHKCFGIIKLIPFCFTFIGPLKSKFFKSQAMRSFQSFDDICKRAGGRRRYNAQRKAAKAERFQAVRELWELYTRKHVRYKRGVQARIARELGVSRTTIARDMVDIRFVEWATANPVKACRFIWQPNAEMRDVPDKIFLMMFGRNHRPRFERRKQSETHW